jgi:GH15 family glucan-1,4-alpha-glucosidase
MDALHQARCHGLPENDAAWAMQRELLDFLEGHWQEPDDGLWEFRGDRQHFTHSKVMAWVALDRAIRNVEEFHRDGPLDRWRALRQQIHDEVLEKGVDDRGVFVQAYGSSELDASSLMVPLVGFLPPDDARVKATVEAIEQELTVDGFVHRYLTSSTTGADGLEGQEGTFLMCTFWLADNLALIGRLDDARKLYERLLGLRNDVGLLAEEYDTKSKRLLGNFPQAFSHVSLVNTAANLSAEAHKLRDDQGPSHQRRGNGTHKR